ncbi:MAG: YbaK/EbsC family protein, partial [candidate division NC10 bacterium]
MSVEVFLREQAVQGELIQFDRETPTVERAAEALEVSTDAIIKSLLFQAKDGECVLVIARGTTRVDPQKLA